MPVSAFAVIVASIPPGVPVTAREIEARLPVHHARSTVRAVLGTLVRQGRAEVEEIEGAQYSFKRYRLAGDAR